MTPDAIDIAVRLPGAATKALASQEIGSASGRRGSNAAVAPLPESKPPDCRMDAEILGKAVRLHTAIVRRQALRLTGNVYDAEDLSQDVFVRVLRSLPDFDPSRGSMEGWLRRITLNLFRDRVRRDRLRQSRSLQAAAEPICSRPGPDEVVLARRLNPHLAAALMSLAPPMLETVLLADVVGLSHREIAARMGVARGTVASRLHRAHARLRAQLAPHESLYGSAGNHVA